MAAGAAGGAASEDAPRERGQARGEEKCGLRREGLVCGLAEGMRVCLCKVGGL
jgi:hypothetical protein